MKHYHVVFTFPGQLTNILFNRGFKPQILNRIAANIYMKEQWLSKSLLNKNWKPGIMSTVHIAGNGLNYNPHVHMVATKDMVHKDTGEIKEVNYINFKAFRFAWQKAVCDYLVKKNIISNEEKEIFLNQYKNGFHVYFKNIDGENNDILFRTAEYLGTNILHNSQIENVDYRKNLVTFNFKSWVDRTTKEKRHKKVTMNVFEFMARMLYFLPDKHEKTIRYYGIYSKPASSLKRRKIQNHQCSWANGITHLFEKNPAKCPACNKEMGMVIIFSFHARKIEKVLKQKYHLIGGYFYPFEMKCLRPP